MDFRKLLAPLIGVAVIGLAWQRYGWPGVALVGSALVLFLLLHFNRTMQVLKRAAGRPIGYVDSAVMLNARLKRGMALLHVTAMTRALGELRSPKGAQPELYRWTDAGGSHVDAEFNRGRLGRWTLARPEPEPPTGPAASERPVP